MTATLTERYIAAAVASIPPASRDDVQAELDVSIADAIDARIEQGEEPAAAERAVLNDLGDPGILAAGYADRPLHLIGPRFYLPWWRLLKLLWAIVPAAAMGGVALGSVLAGAPVGEVIGSSISVGLATAVHLAFWVTIVFVVLERTGSASSLPHWTIDRLPESPSKGVGRADMIASLVFLAAGAGALLWDQFRGFVFHGGETLPALNPELWPWWITGLLAVLAAEAALAIAVYLSGGWNVGFAVINAAIAIAFAVPAIALLATAQLVNPEVIAIAFTDKGVDADTLRTLTIITGAAIAGVATWDVIDGWLKTIRNNRR